MVTQASLRAKNLSSGHTGRCKLFFSNKERRKGRRVRETWPKMVWKTSHKLRKWCKFVVPLWAKFAFDFFVPVLLVKKFTLLRCRLFLFIFQYLFLFFFWVRASSAGMIKVKLYAIMGGWAMWFKAGPEPGQIDGPVVHVIANICCSIL